MYEKSVGPHALVVKSEAWRKLQNRPRTREVRPCLSQEKLSGREKQNCERFGYQVWQDRDKEDEAEGADVEDGQDSKDAEDSEPSEDDTDGEAGQRKRSKNSKQKSDKDNAAGGDWELPSIFRTLRGSILFCAAVWCGEVFLFGGSVISLGDVRSCSMFLPNHVGLIGLSSTNGSRSQLTVQVCLKPSLTRWVKRPVEQILLMKSRRGDWWERRTVVFSNN